MPTLRKRSRAVTPTRTPAIGRFLVNGNRSYIKSSKKESNPASLLIHESSLTKGFGDGSPASPFTLPLRQSANKSGCFHCHQDSCHCRVIEQLLSDTYDAVEVKRIAEVPSARQLCAKSLLPQFVTRIIEIMQIKPSTKFIDFGCGNGSIVFQIACETGADCTGIEISEHNAQVARDAWPVFRDRYEKAFGKVSGSVTIVAGDGAKIISEEGFFDNNKDGNEGTAMLLSNLLFPKPLTHFISERLRTTPVNTRVLCFDDLYPHGRSLAHIRDPEAFELFTMNDYKWQEMSVEWCCQEGSFYVHWRK